MQKVNFLVHSFNISQLSYELIQSIHKCLESQNVNINVFYEEPTHTYMQGNFAIMQMIEAFNEQGLMIATNYSTASKLINIPMPDKKIFYVWDIEWLRGNPRYELYKDIYLSKELTLYCRSEDHSKLIQNCFNKECEVKTFEEIINEYTRNKIVR